MDERQIDEVVFETPDHLTPKYSDRGFKRMPPIPSDYSGWVEVYESSSAMEPRLWLNVECPVNLNQPTGETQNAVAHLSLENAWRLSEQLRLLCETHYQNDATQPAPDWWRYGEEQQNARVTHFATCSEASKHRRKR